VGAVALRPNSKYTRAAWGERKNLSFASASSLFFISIRGAGVVLAVAAAGVTTCNQ